MIKHIPNLSAFVIKTKSQILEWLEDFEQLREQILMSDDSRKDNYTFKRFNLKEQEEVTVVYFKQEIIAFSSLYYRNYYPKNVSRVLNRFWKSPKIRYINQSYWLLSRYMLIPQLKEASLLNKRAVFISIEGKKRNWLSRFIKEAKKEEPEWIHLTNRLYKVAPNDDLPCWQNIAYLPLKPNYKLKFPNLTYTAYNDKFYLNKYVKKFEK
ncbi:MAG: hypothetical protein OXJ52_03980 [Oligoflexia bacterium]|nr:hypothetical protein [Oligoflexia bacterium]